MLAAEQDDVNVNDENEVLTFAQRILKNNREKKSVKFINPFIVSPTSVVVESLFSVAKYIWDDRRLATTPEHIEEGMFLKFNHHLWDLEFFTLNVYNQADHTGD